MSHRYQLLIDNICEPYGFAVRKISILLLDMHSREPVMEATSPKERQSDIEKMVQTMYGDQVAISRPAEHQG